MYVVVISYPIKLFEVFMHITLYVRGYMHAHSHVCMHTHTSIYRIIYILCCGSRFSFSSGPGVDPGRSARTDYVVVCAVAVENKRVVCCPTSWLVVQLLVSLCFGLTCFILVSCESFH